MVGAGVAGLTTAYLLQRDAEVTLYEADERLGGHAHSHDLTDARGRPLTVDTGFLVHNQVTYPNLLRLFAELGVRTQPSEMSMSVCCGGCGLEYAGGRGPSGILPTLRTATRARYLAMLAEVPRFHRQARALLAAEPAADDDLETLGAFLDRGRFSRYFRSHFVTPLVSAVWSCGPHLVDEYPARYLFGFLANHGMLTVTGSPQWRTVTGGSARYVERAAKNLTAVHTSTPVRQIRRVTQGVEVTDDGGRVTAYDAVVVATHPDQALALLAEPTDAERDVLGAFEYSANPTVLHGDTSVLPTAPRAQASWNYLLPACDPGATPVRVSYDLNRLQRLVTEDRFLVTLNDDGSVPDQEVIARMSYAHPVFTPASVAAQRRLPELNDGVLAFAGAYHGWGFHEDGCRAGVRAAESLGCVSWPGAVASGVSGRSGKAATRRRAGGPSSGANAARSSPKRRAAGAGPGDTPLGVTW